VVWELEDWKLAVKIPVAEPRAVMTMADGAFVVVAGRETLRLEQHETKPTRLPRLMLVPGSQLWPDRRDPLTLWVPLGRTLYRYVLPGPDDPPPDRLVPTATLPLEEHDERVFAGLKDGSFLFTTESGLVKFHPEGKATRGPTPVASRDVWRLLSAHRIDRAWVASQSGSLELIDFVANFGVVRRVQVAETLYDIAADDRHFAVVRAHYEPGQRRRWSVALLDTDGKTVFEHPLPAGPRPETSDWVGRETLNRGVALAPDDSCLAVGGPSWVTVWEIDSGRVLLAAETAQQQLTTNDDESSPTTVAPTGSAPTSRHRESGGWERDRARTTGR